MPGHSKGADFLSSWPIESTKGRNAECGFHDDKREGRATILKVWGNRAAHFVTLH